MADQFNLTQAGTLSPEDYAQQQALNRQQRFAEMLMGQNQQPQGQMVSGRYVPRSFFEMLQPAANMIAGAYIGKQSDTEAAKLAEKIRSGRATAEEKITNLTLGTPETATEMAGPYTSKVSMPVGVQPAVAPNLAAALREINSPYSYGAGKELKPLIYKQLMPDPTEQERNYKAAVADGSWNPAKMGGFNNYKNQMNAFQQAEIANSNARLGIERSRAAFEGIPVAGGGGVAVPNQMPQVAPVNAPQGVNQMPQGQMPVVGNQAQQLPLMPPLITTGMSPKAAREAQVEYTKNLQENVNNAYSVYKVAGEIEKTLPKAHGSGIGNIMGGVANFVGYESNQNAADAELKVMSDKLLKAVPRFSGPQSDKDVQSYKEAAGSIGDASLPMNVRLAALTTIKNLNKPYAPNLNWDSQVPKENQPEKVSLGAAPIYATNGNQRIVSDDNGKTWKPAR